MSKHHLLLTHLNDCSPTAINAQLDKPPAKAEAPLRCLLVTPQGPCLDLHSGLSSTQIAENFAIIKYRLDDPEPCVCSLQPLLSYPSSLKKVAKPVGLGYVWLKRRDDSITSSLTVLRMTDSATIPEYRAPGIT